MPTWAIYLIVVIVIILISIISSIIGVKYKKTKSDVYYEDVEYDDEQISYDDKEKNYCILLLERNQPYVTREQCSYVLKKLSFEYKEKTYEYGDFEKSVVESGH